MLTVAKFYHMRSGVVTPPASEPVDLASLKAHLRITSSAEDAALTQILVAARLLVESYTGRKLITQTLEGWLDTGFPGNAPWFPGTFQGPVAGAFPVRTIELPHLPALSVTSVTVYSQLDTPTTVPADTYRVDTSSAASPARITLKEGQVWPAGPYRNQNALKVIWQAGYGPDADDVPTDLRIGVMMLAAFLYSNRGDCCASPLKECGALTLLDSYKAFRL